MPQFRDNFHSEEAQEIMGRAPSWVVRWGITVIFVILALIVLGCYIIKYPQTVTAPISITTVNAPSDLTARYDGLLDSVCVGNGENVRTGQLIALLATPARLRRHPVVGRAPLRHRFAASARRGRMGVRPVRSGRPAIHVGGVRGPLP